MTPNKEHIVSIIVPIYNGEKYLEECITSVLCQSWQHWELLLINDGSTDSSWDICNRYAQKDSRIKPIHQENAGVSAARNRGLDLAGGTYIMFLDADDFWLENQAIEHMVEKAENYRLDLVRGEYKAVDAKGEELFCPAAKEKYANQCIDTSLFIREIIKDDFFGVLFLFRASVIKTLRFEEGRIFLEDMMFLSMLCLQPLRCMYIFPFHFYAYRKEETSVSFRIDARKLKDAFSMCDFFHALSFQTKDSWLKYYFQQKSIKIYRTTLETLALEGSFPLRKTYIDQFHLVRKRKSLLCWMKEYGQRFYHPVYYIHPTYGIIFFRWRHRLGHFKSFCLKLIRNNTKIKLL